VTTGWSIKAAAVTEAQKVFTQRLLLIIVPVLAWQDGRERVEVEAR
jgi:hypothetical protein